MWRMIRILLCEWWMVDGAPDRVRSDVVDGGAIAKPAGSMREAEDW